MRYKAVKSLVVVVDDERFNKESEILLPEPQIQNMLWCGVRKRIPFQDGVRFKIISSGIEGLKEGDLIYAKSCDAHWIPEDEEHYWIDETCVLYVNDVPYKDYVICADIDIFEHTKELGLYVPDDTLTTKVTKAFVFDGGTSELKKGDVVFYNWQKKIPVVINDTKLFFISKEFIKGIIEKD